MEERTIKVQINKAGGNAGRNSKNYRVSIPSAWINELGMSRKNLEWYIDTRRFGCINQ